MRIFISTIITVLASVLAGFLLCAALGQTDWAARVGFLIAGVVVALGSLFWQAMKIQAGVDSLERFATDPSTALTAAFGFVEFERIASLFQAANKSSGGDANPEYSHDKTADFERVLSELESRHNIAPRNRTKIDERLNDLFAVLSKQMDAGLAQALACSREIGKGAQKLVAKADEQSDSVNRITDVIESLSGEILTLGESAESAVESSATAQQFAVSGLDDFQEIVKELEGVKNHVSTRERKLQQLSQHSREIGSIVQSVGTLSSRTDLLALNASIESARAGEHGRGFALVAEEVRALAEQSAQSVADINARVNLIQQETQESIAVAFGEHNQINQLIKRLQETLNSMKKMSDASSYCATSVTEISERTQGQLRLLTDIVNELESTSEISKDNRIQAEGVHWTARTLQQIGEQFNNQQSSIRSDFVAIPADRQSCEVATDTASSV